MIIKKRKNGPPVKEKKDSLKMIALTWILTALAFPVINTLVPAFFVPQEYDGCSNILTPDGDVAWLLVWGKLKWEIIGILLFPLVISFVVGLLVKKELPQFFTQRLARYVLLLATAINSIALIFSIISF